MTTSQLGNDLRERTRAFFEAVERGATGSELLAFYHPSVRLVEYPNLLNPRGVSRDLQAIVSAAERGRSVVRDQRYVIHDLVVEGETAAVRLSWSAELRLPLGERAAGSRIEAAFAVFLAFREGQIAEHHTYDCFAPL